LCVNTFESMKIMTCKLTFVKILISVSVAVNIEAIRIANTEKNSLLQHIMFHSINKQTNI